jgi:hypothetical protein
VRRNHKRRIRSGHRKLLWIFGGAFTICALLYWEQTALLYVLSTLAMCGLMLVVGSSDLEAKDKEIHNRGLEKLSTNSDEWTQTENKAA